MLRNKKLRVKLLWLAAALLVLLNAVAFFHAWKFTHFTTRPVQKTQEEMSLPQKLLTVVTGVDNPRPENTQKPPQPFETVLLQSNKQIQAWFIYTNSAQKSKGTVVLFHGYSGAKSGMLDKAEVFRELGYHTLLVDFMGSGGSEGNQTTLGYKEAEQVKTCVEFLKQRGEQNIHLFGTSMGAVAIMRAVADLNVQPKSIIIECPFGSMYQTTVARFRMLGVPHVPMAGLLVFWGGLQNGFWAFGHQPVNYAAKITCPTLLMYGEQDAKVSRQETDQIFANLQGPKQLRTYPLAGHENYLLKYRSQWTKDVAEFLNVHGWQR